MSVYAVVFDYESKNDIVKLENELKRSKGWWHYMTHMYMVHTTETANQLWSRIEYPVPKNHSLIILEVKGTYQGWLPDEAWKWVKDKLKMDGIIKEE